MFVNVFPIFSKKVAWNMVCELNRVFCSSMSTPAYDIFNAMALLNVANDFVDDILFSAI